MMIKRTICLSLAVGALLAKSLVAAEPSPLHELLPQDTLGFIELSPGPQEKKGFAAGGGRAPLLDLGLQAMQSAGVMKEESTLVADVLGLSAQVNAGRNCIAWLDADLAVTPAGGLECKSSQLIWILETDHPSDMVERLTRLLTHVSTQATARQSVKRTGETHKEFVEFHDTLWPDWLTLAWAQEAADSGPPGRGPRFILALGAGAMEHYLSDRPVGEVPWQQVAIQMDAADPGATTTARIYAHTKLLRDRFPAAVERTVLGRLLTSLNLQQADACIFVARQKDRLITLAGATLAQGKLQVTPWTVALPPDAPLLRALPDEADAYLVLKADWPELYRRILLVADAALNDPTDEPIEALVARLAAQHGVDVQNDILNRLQPLVLIHDSPQHPLQLPLMVTILAAAQPGNDEKVKSAISKIADAIANRLESKSAKASPTVEPASAGTPPKPPTGLQFRLRTDSDGIRYIQFGLVGPAWGWVDNRLVISWSPGSVRTNITPASRVTSSAFALPLPVDDVLPHDG